MNAPVAGWNPDPTGRHEYRYWDGTTWTDDVSDNGVTTVDPVDAAPPADPTLAQGAPQFGQQPGGYPAQPGYDPYGSSGAVPPAQPAKSGPSTGLVVGLAVVAVALIVGLVVVLTGGDDDGDQENIATDSPEQSDDEVTDDEVEDEVADNMPDIDLDDLDTSGDESSNDALVQAMALGLQESSGGAITTEQAECAAEAMLEEIGLAGLIEIGSTGGDPFEDGSLTSEQQAAVITAMTDCIPVDVLMEMGE
jgi:hypothetical protein